jgi:hypothetical protein
MAYTIQTKDGITINNIPDDVDPQSQELKDRVAKIRAENQMSAPVVETAQPERSEIGRTGQLLARGAIPVATGAGVGAMVGGAPGALVGSMALPMADLAALGSKYLENLIRQARGVPETKGFSPSGEVSKALANIGLPEPTSTGERVIEAVGGGLAGVGTQLPALGRLATTATTEAGRSLAGRMAQAPVAQTVVAAPAAGTTQYVGETTENPLLGMAAGMAVGSTAGLRPRQVEKALSAEQLAIRADIAYRNAEKAGVVVSPDSLKGKVPQFEKILKEEGFLPDLHPQLNIVLDAFQKQIETPKTLKELDQLRRTLKAPAKFFENPDQQRITGKLIDEFDDYVKNLSAKDLAVEGAKVKAATKELTKARNFYARSRKADEIDELFRRAEIRAGANFTQSGLENSLRQELKTLALNKKRFSMFSSTEQDAIESAAKGGSIQNILRNIGKYAATSPIPTTGGSALGAGIGALLTGGSPVGAAIGAATVPAVGGAARAGATRMGLNRLEEIQKMISLGRMPEIQARTRLVPVTGLRGLLASPVDQQFEEQQ